MLKRTITGTVIALVTAGFLLLRQYVNVKLFDILIYFMAIVSVYEVTKAFKEKISKIQTIICYVFVAISIPLVVFAYGLYLRFIIFTVVIMIFISVLENKDSFDGIPYTIFAMLYPSFSLCCLSLMNNFYGKYSLYVVLVVLLVASFTDVMAYLIGSLIKGPKLCPNLSPNKTISGAIGGLVGGVMASFACYFLATVIAGDPFTAFTTTQKVLFLIFTGGVLSLVNQLGDLVESFLKRKFGLKDMGTLFPGHGGMMDRIDGLSFVSLTAYVLFSILL